MISHHLVKFGGHWHRGSGDITFAVVQEHSSTCLLESTIAAYQKHAACLVNKSDIGHMHLKQQQEKTTQSNLPVRPKSLTRRRSRIKTIRLIGKLFA